MAQSIQNKPQNLLSNNQFDFDREFEYFYEICELSKQKVYIGKFILEHSELLEKYNTFRTVLVDALFHSAAVNIYKITGADEQLNITKFKNKCKEISKTFQKEKWNSIKWADADLDYLEKRRHKNLAHSDRENITIDIIKEYPLTIEVLERVINATEAMLHYLYRLIKSVSLGGINTSTGEYMSVVDRRVKTECKSLQNMFEVSNAIFEHMKTSNPDKLFDIIYSDGERKSENEEVKNAHAE